MNYEPLPEPPMDDSELTEALEAERAVLGSILLEAELYELAEEKLRFVEFGFPTHRKIFNAMRALASDEKPIDLVLVTSKLQDREELDLVGGVSYLTQLANSVPTTVNFLDYCHIVKEKHIGRQGKSFIRSLLQEDDPEKLIAGLQESAARLSDQAAPEKEFSTARDVAQRFFDELEHRYNHQEEVTGVPSGYPDLDKMTTGFQKSDLIIVAARPSVGKTAFALNIAQNVGIRAKETVAIFSLEMSETQLMQRMFAAEGNVDASRLRTGRLEGNDWEKITMAISDLSEAPIYIDDTPSISTAEIRAKCRRLKKEKGLGMILIDYLQLIQGRRRSENRQQEVTEISRTLKKIARELEVPVVALSQLSRAVEQRQDKKPMLSDLRESGSLEQDADIVAFLYRDDYYNAETEKKGITEIIIAKQRNGPVGTVELLFLKNYNKFLTLDRGHHQNEPAPQRTGSRVPDMYGGGRK